MSINEIRKHNEEVFIDDIKRVSECMVLAETTGAFFTIKKMDVKRQAETQKINYKLTKSIFTVGRLVMVVL